MNKVIEISAMSQEEAITRALKIAEATPEQVVKVVEKQKSRSFLGIFNKQGIYEIEINKDIKKEIKKEIPKVEKVKKEVKIEKKKEIKETSEKKKIVKEIKKEVPKVEKVKKEIKENKENNVEKNNIEPEVLIKEKAKELLDHIGLNLKIKVKKQNSRNYLVDLSGEDNGIIIGKKGKTLNSFEYLLNFLVKDYRIEVDVQGFKEKRLITLRQLGKKMAEKALKTGKTVRLNPMPPRERKIIHEVINQYEELDTFSEGRDPKRYIVIKKKR